jgi:8-oxo-dGTP pyrophosphatase MutT (NUDIX family)
MRWTVHGERSIYESEWVSLHLVDVEIPGGARFDHHVVRAPHPASGTVVHDPDRGILLLWRHRFITDTWGWEIPAGRIDPGETPEECAGRECLEETGWQPGTLERLTTYAPANGMIDQRFHLFLADGAVEVGEPTDPGESERIEWVAVEVIRQEIAAGRVLDGLSLTALLWSFAFGRI